VKLMNRKESKYIINRKTLALILDKIHEDYFILEIQKQRLMPYESRYFDSPHFDLYNTHQNGKLNRYKIRKRTYMTTGLQFLELKFKNNKKRTIKKRIEITETTHRNEIKEFLYKYYPDSINKLREVLKINYDRITLVDKSLKERITIDLNLRFTADHKSTSYEDMAIIEIKHEGDLKSSSIDRELKEKRIKPISISKYCLGIYRHYDHVKTNRIKIKIREMNKALNAAPSPLRGKTVNNKAS
jgi:hypothetical protein